MTLSTFRRLAAAGAALAWAAAAGQAAAQECKMSLAAQLPVVMDRNQPLARVSIDGKPVLALIDTGAWKTLLWRGAADRLGLKLTPVEGLRLVGVGGAQQAYRARIKELKLGDAVLKDTALLVGGRTTAMGGREEIALVLGQDLLSRGDLEIDLKNKVIRLFKVENCKGKPLVYWTPEYFIADLVRTPGEEPRSIKLDVLVNGRPVRAVLDTGAVTTVLTTDVARRAGVSTASDEVIEGGRSVGVGRKAVTNWIGRFDTVQIGDETIQKAALRIADLFRHSREAETGTRIEGDSTETQMLLGADFLQAHRVFVSYSQDKMFFSYNGGPVFQVRGPRAEELDAPPAP